MVTKKATLLIALCTLLIGAYAGFFGAKAIEFEHAKEIIAFQEWALGQHQYYLDNPDEMSSYTGNVTTNEWAVEMYERTIKELLK